MWRSFSDARETSSHCEGCCNFENKDFPLDTQSDRYMKRKAASTRVLLRVWLLTLKRPDFEVSSPYVSTRSFMSVRTWSGAGSQSLARHHQVWSVSSHRSHEYRYEASAARCYCWLCSKKIKEKTEVWTKSWLAQWPARGSYSMLFRELKVETAVDFKNYTSHSWFFFYFCLEKSKNEFLELTLWCETVFQLELDLKRHSDFLPEVKHSHLCSTRPGHRSRACRWSFPKHAKPFMMSSRMNTWR